MKRGEGIPGTLELELTSAQPEDTLDKLSKEGIRLSGIARIDELRCRFRIDRKAYPELQETVKKNGDKICVVKKHGLYWKVCRFLKRPALVTGMLLLLAVVFYLPTRVFFVRVEGNDKIPQNRILEAAEACGIEFGASRRNVRSEKMKNALLAALPQLQWAGINTSGCVAVISVREGAVQENAESKGVVTSIAADRDGFILSGTVTQGQGLFSIGETVRKGQILISGYRDCGLCIRAERAQGEVVAQTVREIEVITPAECSVKAECLESKKRYSLIFRKKRINLWKDSGISHGTCGRMYKEYYITLPGGFRLPCAFCVDEYTWYQTGHQERALPDVRNGLSSFAEHLLTQQMVAGSIRDKAERIYRYQDLYRLSGSYVCTEMIGREVSEQIGEINGKNN